MIPQIKTRFFKSQSLRGVQLNSLSGIRRGGRAEYLGADGARPRDPSQRPAASCPEPAPRARPRPNRYCPVGPAAEMPAKSGFACPLPNRSQDTGEPSSPSPRLQLREPRVGQKGPGEGGVPVALQMRVRKAPSPPAPAATRTGRTARPWGLRLFAAGAAGRGLRAGLGLDSDKGRGGQETDDWAKTVRPRI